VIALLQDAHSALSGSAEPTVRVIAGICALVMVFLIIHRRRKKDSEP
jgi:LPXTG-motif cell wall-anchored protein